jgi:hypothetical protein
VIAWEAGTTLDGSNYEIAGQRFNSAGAFVNWDGSALAAGATRAEVRLDAGAGYNEEVELVTLSGGRVLVLSEFADTDVVARLYGANGAVLTDEFRVNVTTAGSQARPNAVELADGRVVVAWSSNGQDGSGWGLYGESWTRTAPRSAASSG